MTCQECEIKLGMGEGAGDHLASCEECRRLAEDLRLNAVALRELRVRPPARWAWALIAAAAAIVITLGLWRVTPRQKPPQKAAAANIGRPTRTEPVVPVKHVRKKRLPAEPLRVKMFTSDPDVVIYWIVDKKEGYE